MHKQDIHLTAVTELCPLTSSPFILYLPVSQHTLASSTSPSIPFSLSSFSILSFSFLLLMSSIAKIYTKCHLIHLRMYKHFTFVNEQFAVIFYNFAIYYDIRSSLPLTLSWIFRLSWSIQRSLSSLSASTPPRPLKMVNPL